MSVPTGVGGNTHHMSLPSLASKSAFFPPLCGQHTERNYPQSQRLGTTPYSPTPPEVGLLRVDKSLRTATSAPTFYPVDSLLHRSALCRPIVTLVLVAPSSCRLPACHCPVFFPPAIPSSSSHTSSPSVSHLYMPCRHCFLCTPYLHIFMRSVYPFCWDVPIIN